jgi:2,4-diaminopentanoate dehydrogenase
MTQRYLRVVEWSTGTVGKHAIAGILARPELELVGVWVSSDEKDGKDVGELCGTAPLGLAATQDKDALVALKPDCVVHTAMTDADPFAALGLFEELLAAGINVVSSGPVFLQYPNGIIPDDMVEKLHDAGRRGGASVYVNGIDPGFANDVLPLVLTSLSQRVDEVRCSEIADYSTYYQPFVNAELFGFGKPMDVVPPLFSGGILTMAWGSVVRIIAAGLGVTLDEPLTETVEFAEADEDVKTVNGVLEKGTRCGVRFAVIGSVDGTPRVVLEHVTRTHPDQRPDWPQPADGDGCYRVEVKGEPMMTLDLVHRGENGDHNVSGMIVTAMRLVNAVEAVVDAEPGLVTALDLPLFTARGLVRR